MCQCVCVCDVIVTVTFLPSIATQIRAYETFSEWIILNQKLGYLIVNKRVNVLIVYIIMAIYYIFINVVGLFNTKIHSMTIHLHR